jgi:tRNA(fMet)-specific endonuclease VapC
MTWLLDTDTLSEIVRRRPSPALLERLSEVDPGSLFTSVINVAELRYGAALREDRDPFWRKIEERIISQVRVVGLDERAAPVAGDIRAHLRTRGEKIGLADVLIGAIALAKGLTVVTNNLSHFSRIPGLKAVNWIS